MAPKPSELRLSARDSDEVQGYKAMYNRLLRERDSLKRASETPVPERIRSAKTRRITGPIITIKAGRDLDETFEVHKHLLKERPTFFDSALGKTRWKESVTGTIELQYDDPDTVAAYVEWLYRNKIASKGAAAETTVKEDQNEDIYLASLYAFGEKVQDNKFCNAVITAWAEKHDQLVEGEYRYFDPESIRIIYTSTPESSPARRYIVDVISKYGSREWLTQKANRAMAFSCPEFLFELAVKGLPDGERARHSSEKLVGRKQEWFKKE